MQHALWTLVQGSIRCSIDVHPIKSHVLLDSDGLNISTIAVAHIGLPFQHASDIHIISAYVLLHVRAMMA
jgi:hypothetical protein